MTTYLATQQDRNSDDFRTIPLCADCHDDPLLLPAPAAPFGWYWDQKITPDFIESYEFDEVCANCGTLVSQSPLTKGDLVLCSDGDVCIVEAVSTIDPLAWVGRTE